MEQSPLRLFIDNTSSNLQDVLASNALLDWFGKSVRSSDRISKFFKDQITVEYEHQFTTVVETAAFEEKEAHHRTKSTPPENVVVNDPPEPSTSTRRSSSRSPRKCSQLVTPPKQLISISSEPPPMRSPDDFLPLSDDECEAVDKSMSTPKKQTKVQATDSESPPLMHDSLVSTPDHSDEGDEPKLKKPKITDPHPPVPVVPAAKSQYSDLKYLEAVGVLRQKHNKKHRGVIPELNVSMNQSAEVANANEMSPTSSQPDCWERKTRLKISYRINDSDGQVQFALIVYEHVTKNSRTRRNLMLDFQAPDSPVAPNEKRTPKKRINYLKRQLRL